jgi:outer membrane protein OmpA-like peptidoglycan-associated protein
VLRALLNGRSYRVAVPAVNAAGSGPAATTRVRLAAWFHDPLRGRRAGELRVPSDPAAYQGPLRWTTARNRSHDGSAAIGTGALRDRQLQPGQAVGLGTDALFAFDSPALDAAGRRAIKAIVRSLRYVSKVVCEGYADYGGSDSREVTLSRQRAETVCAALRASGVHVVTAAVGYGSARPVRVGGSHAQRAANRRVIVRITR